MRKRIGQLAAGKFECAKPILEFSEKVVEISVIEDRDETGSFTIECTNQMKIRGVVYSTNPRMECLTEQFEGEKVRIRYQFHSKGLKDGETSEGLFVIVCNQREYSLSFCAKITKLYAQSADGLIKDIDDFVRLAQNDWREAYHLFYSKNFENIISDALINEKLTYRGIVAARPTNQNLEEFLIGIHKKNPVAFSVDKSEEKFVNLTENISSNFTITKDIWGYIEIRLRTDCDFIKLSKPIITLDDFIGKTYRYDYEIEVSKMHGGKNYGRIYIDGVYQSFSIDVTAVIESADDEGKRKLYTDIKDCRMGIMELYQAYRLKHIVTGVWANETITILNHLHALLPDEPMYVLMKAQAYIINRQRQEAEWILDDFKRSWSDRKAPVWGYYLYLLTLMEREPAYVDKMTQEIEIIFRENPDSVMLFWVLSFLQEQYFDNSARKLKAIEYWVLKGCSSPYLYFEAFYVLWQDPYLLTKLDKFEIRILRWAIKKKALTKELASAIFNVVELGKGFNQIIYKLLCDAYEVVPSPENAGIICSYLIKAHRYQNIYHDWYEIAIKNELRITGLYEAYLLSMDDRKIAEVPKIIQMYFQYDSSLPYRKLAVLYNNIVAAKETEPEVYMKYQRSMGHFAMQQVELGHMDDNLAVLYDDMIDLGFINEELAHALSNIIFTNKLVVFDKRIVRAIIYQNQIDEPQIVPVVDQAAYFQLYSNDYVIIFEDKKGYRYADSISYRLQKLMNAHKYINKCIALAPFELPYMVYKFKNRLAHEQFTNEDKQFFVPILFNRLISPSYRATLLPEVLRFYHEGQYDDTVKELLQKCSYDTLSVLDRRYLMDMLVWNHMFDEAYDLVKEYGIDQLSPSSKTALAVYEISVSKGDEDDLLMPLVVSTFTAGKYNDAILKYLVDRYIGPTDVMIEIWNAAENFEIDSTSLCERIIEQALYVQKDPNSVYDIFKSYCANSGKELIVLAYISAVCHDFLIDDKKADDDIFDVVESRYISDRQLNDACLLALLKHYSKIDEITHEQYLIEDELLASYTQQNMFFKFYSRLDRRLIEKYHLYDKVFLQFKGLPKQHIVLHYSRDEDGNDFEVEEMTDVYDGIYVKSFVMFFGEMIRYYITLEDGESVEVKEKSRITNNNVYKEDEISRYNIINQMIISQTLLDEDTLRHNMQQYFEYDELTKQIFTIL